MKIRSDLVGIVTAYKDGMPISLKAGDTVPAGVIVGEHVAVGTQDSSPFAGMKVAEMKAYAADHNIDLGEATKTAEVRAVLVAAVESEDDAESDDSAE